MKLTVDGKRYDTEKRSGLDNGTIVGLARLLASQVSVVLIHAKFGDSYTISRGEHDTVITVHNTH